MDLRSPNEMPLDPPPEQKGQATSVLTPNRLVCRSCQFILTDQPRRIRRQGQCQFVLANPFGLLFEIELYAQLFALPLGPPSSEFTWFPGYCWQVLMCPGCNQHLGWFFSRSDDAFWALIRSRIQILSY
ncbi:MAG: hypothetical protein H6510_10865 [Acidobacteria bacterium]|nr:hypothetical protein [Acidobacteriota bacterium]MCB9398311.1 hypothetical protein [Acidobacteriota bacterium]